MPCIARGLQRVPAEISNEGTLYNRLTFTRWEGLLCSRVKAGLVHERTKVRGSSERLNRRLPGRARRAANAERGVKRGAHALVWLVALLPLLQF